MIINYFMQPLYAINRIYTHCIKWKHSVELKTQTKTGNTPPVIIVYKYN